MRRTALSLKVFGGYLVVLGLALLLVPNTVAALVFVPQTQEVWIRVVGMLVLFLGYYYLLAARSGLSAFFHWTVPPRASVLVFFTALVLFAGGPPSLVAFALVDLAGAAWTYWALKKDAAEAKPA